MVRPEAKAALRQLGYKGAAAKEAVERAWAALEQPADVVAIVTKALELDRAAMQPDVPVSRDDTEHLARKALVQSGFSVAVAKRAVDVALQRVGADAELAVVLAEAFRQCGST